MDAIRFLDLYLEAFPDAVVCGWRDGKTGHGRRILEGYLSILSAGTNLGGTCCYLATDLLPYRSFEKIQALFL